jgi:hypothetical protein
MPEHSSALVLTPEQAAAALNVPERTIERWRSTGAGPRFVKLGRRVAYRPVDLAAFVEAQVRTHTGQNESAPTRTTGTRR